MTKILTVDDDPKLLGFIATQLRGQGYQVETALDGQECLDKSSTIVPDLIILDIAMPRMDGIEALKRLRDWYDGSIIILSAIDEERQKVEALDLGADDYLTKPFSAQELLARVRSALRRAERSVTDNKTQGSKVQVGDSEVDLANRLVVRNGEEVSLTRTEYDLLSLMAKNLGKVMTHRELLREVWGPEYGDETEYLRTFIKQLRRKLEPEPSRPAYLLTQPGIGYRLVG